jgi:hypothetical protein
MISDFKESAAISHCDKMRVNTVSIPGAQSGVTYNIPAAILMQSLHVKLTPQSWLFSYDPNLLSHRALFFKTTLNGKKKLVSEVSVITSCSAPISYSHLLQNPSHILQMFLHYFKKYNKTSYFPSNIKTSINPFRYCFPTQMLSESYSSWLMENKPY